MITNIPQTMTVQRSMQEFIDESVARGRQALPGVDIGLSWADMWIGRVGTHCVPLPDVTEPEQVDWPRLAGLAARYLCDAIDYWYFSYRPKPGDVVVDIGAGRGEDVLAFSCSVGRTGRVFAIDAHPVSFAALRIYCEWNGLANVTALNVACVSKPGELYIETLRNWQSSHLIDAATTGTSYAVTGSTFDALWKSCGMGRIDLLKMNIEGAERDALPGCREAFENTRNVISRLTIFAQSAENRNGFVRRTSFVSF